MIDVQPAVPAHTASQPSESSFTLAPPSQEAPCQTPQEQPQPVRHIEKLTTEESQAVRMDPAIQELLKLFNGEINMITKDVPTDDAAQDRPTETAVKIHIDSDDEEELA